MCGTRQRDRTGVNRDLQKADNQVGPVTGSASPQDNHGRTSPAINEHYKFNTSAYKSLAITHFTTLIKIPSGLSAVTS